MEEKLKNIYYNPSTGFTDLSKFYNRVKESKLKVSYNQVKEFYEKQAINQIYKNQNKQETRTSIIAYGVGECLQADLVDIKKFKFKNSNNKYILNVIDVYSRYVWSFPIKNKYAKSVFECMEKVYNEIINKKYRIYSLTTDSGNEFDNKLMNDIHKKLEIKHYTIVSKKANHPTVTGIIERFNKTLWGLISKYTEANDSVKFVDVLPKLIENYNNNFHGGIKAKPNDVYNKKAYPNQEIHIAEKYNIGDYVRIKQKKKKLGAKSYESKFSRIIYKVVDNKNGHILCNIATNRNLLKNYQYADLQLVPPDTIQKNSSNKAQEIADIDYHENIKRLNKKTGLDVDPETGKIIMPKNMKPKEQKRISKVVEKYGSWTK